MNYDEDSDFTPFAPNADSKSISIPSSSFNSHLVCTLCDGYFRSAHTIAECLHTFCKGCIYLFFLNSGQTACPICFEELGPYPLTKLIFDRTMQEIVDRIHPDIQKLEAEEEIAFYKKYGFEPKSMEVFATASNKKVLEDDFSDKIVGTTMDQKDVSVPIALTDPNNPAFRQFGFMFLPNLSNEVLSTDQLPPLKLPYIRALGTVKIQQLKKYLAKQLNIEDFNVLEISCRDVPLGPELSVHFILRTRWLDNTKDMVLKYRTMET